MNTQLKLVLLLLVTFITGGSGAIAMSNQKQYRFGRFSVDLPLSSVVTIDATYMGISVQGPKAIESVDDFKKQTDQEAARYDNAAMKVSKLSQDIFTAGGLHPDQQFGSKQLVEYQFDVLRSRSFIAYHPNSSTSDTTLKLSQLSSDVIFDFTQKNGMATQVAEAFAALVKASSAFHVYTSLDVIPSHAFCIWNGCFNDGGKQSGRERALLQATIGGREDTEFSISTNARARADQDYNDIEASAADDISSLKRLGGQVSILHKGYRTLLGQKGYEVAVSVSEAGKSPYYIFVWSGSGELRNPLKPIMDVDLRIMPDEHGQSTVSTPEEAQEIWDALVGSIQAR